jgi:hypothetical protein
MDDKPNEPIPPDTEPRFRYQIWDLLTFMTSMACFLSATRLMGWVAIAMLPVFLIAPSVLAHPDNTRSVKVVFVVAMLLMTVIFYARGM